MKHIYDGYKAGVNLGGWISQCDYTAGHMDVFIKKENIKQIASWGCDHVRLPIDSPVLEDDERPFVYKEEGFGHIDDCVAWCKEYGLNVVMDMHRAPGYAFYLEEQPLFTDAETQERYYSLWEFFAKRYVSERDNVIFELMNEITDPRGDAWNNIARRAVERIQAVDPGRYIMLGGPDWNSASGLDKLEVWDDPHIVYTFHCYEPFVFTHQRASWTHLKDSGINQPYPGKLADVDKLREIMKWASPDEISENVYLNKQTIADKLKPATDFYKRTGKKLYCGEYGPITHADLASRVNWTKDITELLNEYGIGKSFWSYKGMGFTTIDENGMPVDEELIRAISSK